MKGVRIAMVVSVFPVQSETFIVSKAVGLIAAGWDVHIVCQRFDRILFGNLPAEARQRLTGRVHAAWRHRPKWLAAGLAPIALLWCFLRRPIGTVRYLARDVSLGALYLDAELVALAPTIIHFEFGTLAVGRMHVGPAIGARTVVSFRGYDLNYVGLEDPAYYRSVWQGATAIHTLGEDLWQRAVRRGCATDRLRALIPPAIDIAQFDPGDRVHSEVLGTSARPVRILSVGRLEWKKGYEYALEAVALLRDRGVHCEYHIIGSGEFHTATAYARYQLGLTEIVTMLGSQSPAEVQSEMKCADVMLHAAVSEGFGNAVIEAQAMKLPVVCTSADGLKENVADKETGIVVPTRDPAALAAAMERLASDPALRARMGVAGRARVEAKFQIAGQIAAFGALYQQVTSSGGSARATKEG